MTRKEINKEIEGVFGQVPTMFKSIPDRSLELEWKLFKAVQLDESPIPNKYRELIGIGISATTKCKYCAFFHTEVAKLFGATDEEVEDAVHFAKATSGWSSYINGLQLDFEEFKKEILGACNHIRSMQGAG